MKILIFGGTGFLGVNLVEYLVKHEYHVTVYSREESISKFDKYDWRKKVEFIVGVFSEENNFDEIISGYDVIIHLISASVPSIMNPLLDINAVVIPTLRLLDACVMKNISRVIYFSSGGTVYGIPQNIPISEQSFLNPISSYGTHKLIIEKYLEMYKKNYNLNYITVRLSNPYGKGQRAFSNQGLIANVLGNYFAGRETIIYGDGNVVRDYIYVDDVMRAIDELILYGGKECIFNIGSGKGYSINEIIGLIENILGDSIIKRKIAGRRQDVPINILDINKIMSETDWQPKIDIESGIRKVIEYMNN